MIPPSAFGWLFYSPITLLVALLPIFLWLNVGIFLEITCRSYSFSSLDNKVITYVSFSIPSSDIASRGSITNGSFSSGLT